MIARRKPELIVALVLAMLLELSVCIVAANIAFAHVRDQDRHRLCNGYRQEMRHFHDGGWRAGYYFHTKFDHRSGHYVIFHTWKTGIILSPYDKHRRRVDCNKW